MQIYNTLTRKKEKFKPVKWDKIKIYYCGPTVYNYAHIGNLKTFVFEDIVVRTFRFLWEKVETTMNITDIDDKTIRDSQKAGETLRDFTKKYAKIFLEDLEKLWIQKADNIIYVTSVIPEITRLINTMLRRKNAYLWEDASIYFDISSFKNYWKLSNLDLKSLKKNARINNDEYDKDNFWDFVLWKSWKKEDWDNFWWVEFKLYWEDIKKLEKIDKNLIEIVEKNENEALVKIKWRPGWHIECSACNMKAFGPQIDIHMWGQDLIFPHHENEIAQTESCTKKQFAKYWLHSGHLMVDWKKMSKSLGNFYTLRNIEEKFSNEDKNILYRAIRLGFINWKYRESIDFSFEKLKANINTIKKIDNTIKNLKEKIDLNKSKYEWVRKEFSIEMQEFIWEYIEKLEDDFNTPEALKVFFEFNKFVNEALRDENFSIEEYKSLFSMYETFNEVLNIIDFEKIEKKEEIPAKILEKFEARNKAKKEKNFILADSLRDELLKEGYKIIDTRDWAKLEKI